MVHECLTDGGIDPSDIVPENRTVEGWPAFHNPLYSRQTAMIKHRRMNKIIKRIMSDYLPLFVIYCGPVAE